MNEPAKDGNPMQALTNQRKDRFMASSNLTADLVRQYLNYDAVTGFLTWKQSFLTRAAGARAGCLHKSTGYWRIGLLGGKHQAHRLVWLITHGEWPLADIDHLNGDRTDNRLCNLRQVDRRTNIENQRKSPVGSRSQLLGAQWHKPTASWRSKIRSKGQEFNLGAFPTPEAAHAAYVEAKRKLHLGNTL